jgi:hypothetical protein
MNKFSPRKSGMVKIYIRPEIEAEPWIRRLGGRRTTKTLLKAVCKQVAKHLKRRLKEIHCEAYKDGWILLCNSQRIIWSPGRRGSLHWHPGEEWVVRHEDLHREHAGYDD